MSFSVVRFATVLLRKSPLDYRCYLLDAANRILHFETADFAADGDAKAWATGLCDKYPDYHAVELWSLERKVLFQHCHQRGSPASAAE